MAAQRSRDSSPARRAAQDVRSVSVLRRKAAMARWATIKGKYPGYIRTLTPEEIAEHHHRDEEL